MARSISIRSITASRQATGAALTGASATGAMAVGAPLVGPSAMGPLAIGASAIGALAIGRTAIANAVIRKLRAEEVEIGSLKVRELEVAGQRGPPRRQFQRRRSSRAALRASRCVYCHLLEGDEAPALDLGAELPAGQLEGNARRGSETNRVDAELAAVAA